MIKQLNPKEAVSLALVQVVEIFKKCMLIDEELFMRIA
jgi:hypothetical protein